jgi:hypothetical protein
MSSEGVTYTVKELIQMLESTLTGQMNEIATKIESLSNKIDTKASEIRVQAIEARQVAAEERLKSLELAQAGSVAVAGYKKILVAAIVSLSAGGIGELIYLLATSGSH